MNCNAARVDGCNAGWGEHNHSFGNLLFERSEEGCFACSGLSGEEDVRAGVLYELPGKVDFFVLHNLFDGFGVSLHSRRSILLAQALRLL